MKNIVILIALTAFQSAVFSQVGVIVSSKPNEIAPAIVMKDSWSKWHSLQLNFISTAIIPHDDLNQNTTSVSVFSAYSIGALFVLAPFGSDGREWPAVFPESSFVRKLFTTILMAGAIPYFLSNSQHHFNILGYDTISPGVFRSSLFLGTQTDYFDRGANWWRFAFSVGVEFLIKPSDPHSSSGFAVGVQIAANRNLDTGGHIRRIGKTRLSLGLRLTI